MIVGNIRGHERPVALFEPIAKYHNTLWVRELNLPEGSPPVLMTVRESDFVPLPEEQADGFLPSREEIARALEEHAMRAYGWSDEQFELWWTKDRRNTNHEKRYEQAELILDLIRNKRAEYGT